MTTNRWLKNSAREFAAHAGIAYVSARRQVLEVAERDGIPYSAAVRLLMDAYDADHGTTSSGETKEDRR